jgi:hypothetical protein
LAAALVAALGRVPGGGVSATEASAAIEGGAAASSAMLGVMVAVAGGAAADEAGLSRCMILPANSGDEAVNAGEAEAEAEVAAVRGVEGAGEDGVESSASTAGEVGC